MSKPDTSSDEHAVKQREIGLDASPAPDQASTDQPIDFEKSLEDLEAIVARMEGGELSLEASLKEFQRGIELTRACQKALQEAELRVKIVMEGADGELSTKEFDA